MIPKLFRLKHKRDFDTLFAEGKFAAGALVTVKYWHIDPEKYPRRAYAADDLKIGFVVGTKVSKSAVARNRVKRRMRETVRLLLKDDRVRHGYLVAVMAKPEARVAEYADLEKDIVSVLNRARLLR